MFLNDMMNEKHMTRTDLRRETGLPESTLRNILNGKTQIDHCEASTLLSLANVLDTTVEDILCKYWAECESYEKPEKKLIHDPYSLLIFYMVSEATLIKLHDLNDVAFVHEMYDLQWIERFYSDGLYRAALFLLGLVDYLSRLHHLKLNPKYDQYRKLSLDMPVYSINTLGDYDDPDGCAKAKANAECHSIPEFAHFNIFLTREDVWPPKSDI